jgi:hypothetical protein
MELQSVVVVVLYRQLLDKGGAGRDVEQTQKHH